MQRYILFKNITFGHLIKRHVTQMIHFKAKQMRGYLRRKEFSTDLIGQNNRDVRKKIQGGINKVAAEQY